MASFAAIDLGEGVWSAPDRQLATGDQAISFGSFRLLPKQQLLLEADKPVRLGSRALEILTALVERAGEMVTKEEIIARVWPDTVVEEGNLRVHLNALRRALGDGQAGKRYVATVPGRGYRFVAPVAFSKGPEQVTLPAAEAARSHNLPATLTRMVGRDDVVAALANQLPQMRFISLVGPGGIGKTTVALAVANRLIPRYRDGGRYVDLAPLADPLLVTGALASVLGVSIRCENPRASLIPFLRSKQMLLVLDSCEHVVDAAAALAEEVLHGAPDIHILTTSREPLRARGERVVRLSPLEVPEVSAALTADEALAYPAIQLFVERAVASLDTFELSDADAATVANICRRLDGIALAIELAAGRIDVFGVRGLATHLDDRLRLLKAGRRTALPRHRTLSATIDWSYDLLPDLDRVILRRLAVFAGRFTLEAASVVVAGAVTVGAKIAASDVVDHIANLVAKSLVSADIGGPNVYYRLLDTTRAYALMKLIESGERDRFSLSHAEYYRGLLELGAADRRRTAHWLTTYGPHIDDIRVALDWAFSSSGDTNTGIALVIAAVPVWVQMSLMDECRRRVEQALAHLELDRTQPRRKMQLHAALGWAVGYTAGPVRETTSAWTTALECADRLDDADYRLRSLFGLWIDCLNRGRYRESLAFAQGFHSAAADSMAPGDVLIGDRMIGSSLYFLGDLVGAREHIEHMLGRYVAANHPSHTIRFLIDQRVTVRANLAEILWLQGFPDQAMRTVEANVKEACDIDHAISVCNVLAKGCLVALFAGDLSAAERFLGMLLDHSTRHALRVWHARGRAFQGVARIRRGDAAAGLTILEAALNELRDIGFALFHTMFTCNLAEALGQAGQIAQAVDAIDEAFERSDRNEERWCVAELWRVKGELLLLGDAAKAAEEHFHQSLEWSRRQQALSWELRTAVSLSRLHRRQGRIREAHERLPEVYRQFGEGLETADLKSARALLEVPV